MGNLFTWKLHGDGKTLAPGEVVEPDERLTWTRTIGIGAQHVIAMFGATFLVPILTHFDPSTTLFFTAMSTALFLLINKNVLPSYLGSSFGFIAPIAAVASAGKGIPAASFGIMVTGLLLALVGVAVHFAGAKWIDIIMPPVVNGAIVAIIGFNLAPSVWSNWQKGWDTALVTLLAVLLIAVLFRGLVGRLNILLGVIVGYVYACFRGQVDFFGHRRRGVDRLSEIPSSAGRLLDPADVHPRRAGAGRRERRPRQVCGADDWARL